MAALKISYISITGFLYKGVSFYEKKQAFHLSSSDSCRISCGHYPFYQAQPADR